MVKANAALALSVPPQPPNRFSTRSCHIGARSGAIELEHALTEAIPARHAMAVGDK